MSWLSRTPSMDTSSLSRDTAPSLKGAKASASSRAINFIKASKREDPHQESIQSIRAADGIANDAFAVQLDFHLSQPIGRHGIVVGEVGGAHDTAHHDHLRFRVNLNALGAFENQISVGEHMRDSRA